MPARKNRGALTGSGREQLSNIARRAKSSVRKVKRALILCQADEGLNDQQISQALLVETATVSRVRQRFVKEGLESALNERPRPGQRPKLDGKPEARLVAVARSHAPAGHPRYTLRLLADNVVELEFADSASPEMVRQVLSKRTQGVAEEGVVYFRGMRRVYGPHGRVHWTCARNPTTPGAPRSVSLRSYTGQVSVSRNGCMVGNN
jgi:transposase